MSDLRSEFIKDYPEDLQEMAGEAFDAAGDELPFRSGLISFKQHAIKTAMHAQATKIVESMK